MKKLLFLCTGNYYRSRFAEYYFRHHASGLDWSVDSRGLSLSANNLGPLSEHTIAECQRLGISYLPWRLPMALSRSELEESDLVIAVKEGEHRPLMQQHFPDWEHHLAYWHVHDLDCAQPQESLEKLRGLVDGLIHQLGVTNLPGLHS